VGSSGIFDAFDEAPGEAPDEDLVSIIEDDSREQPRGNPFDETAANAAPEEAEKKAGEENPALKTEEKREPETGRETGEEQKPFSPSKAPANTVLNGGPRKLNKQLILRIGVGTLAFFITGATFIAPLFKTKKTLVPKKPDTAAMRAVDYSALVSKKERGKPVEAEEPEDDDEILDSLPPVNPEYRYTPPEEKRGEPAAVSGSGNGSGRPDTKGDSLQGKNISGIKGISPTQKQYAQGNLPSREAASLAEEANPYARFGMPSREDYAARMLSGYGQGGTPGYGSPSSYANQNDQSGKQLFHTAGRENAGNGAWLGPATVWQGTIFEATLTGDINTDLPGEATAVISKNVYSSLDGRYLLIPQNSKLFGSYNSSISYSQSRVQVAWHTLIRPDGYAVNLGNMAAADSRGAAGLKGFINDHPLQYVKAIALMSVFNIINGEFENTAGGTDNQYVQNVLADSQSVTNTLGSKLIDRALDVQPTITIKAGLGINIVANTTLTLPPLQPYEVTRPYRR
jgi:type IV secretion system protein VirB10